MAYETAIGFMTSIATERSIDIETWYQESNNETTISTYADLMFDSTPSSRVKYGNSETLNGYNNVYIAGHIASLICVLVSIGLLTFVRSMERIHNMSILHYTLFVACALDSTMSLMWYTLVVENPSVLKRNAVWCTILHWCTIYTMLSTYLFLFIMGLNMLFGLVQVDINEAKLRRWYIGVGWGVPILIDAVYLIVRSAYGDTKRCWIEIEKTHWVITLPVTALLIVSLGILFAVVYLTLKSSFESRTKKIIKTLHAVISLIPLFGIQYVSQPFRPPPGSKEEATLDLVIAILTSHQGVIVAVLYCFLNCEVILSFKEKFRRRNANAPVDEPIPMNDLPA